MISGMCSGIHCFYATVDKKGSCGQELANDLLKGAICD